MLFGDPSRKYRRKAQSLVSNCQAFAMTTFDDFASACPVVGALSARGDTERWDVVMTVAGVGIALAEIEDALPEKQFEAFYRALLDRLRPWYANADQLLQHQVRFVSQRAEHGVARPSAVGEWVVSNLKGGPPTHGDLAIAPLIGKQLQTALDGWWIRIN